MAIEQSEYSIHGIKNPTENAVNYHINKYLIKGE